MSGSILVVAWYGVVGSRIAADLAADFPDRVLVAGRHLDRAEAIAAALDGVSLAVNCIDQPDRGLLRAAIERKLAYTDITPHSTGLGRGAGYQRVDAAARATEARIVLGAGLVPGISSVLVRKLADALGGANRIETALLLGADDLSGLGSFDYLLQELTMVGLDVHVHVHVDGTDRPARPYTAPRVVTYPAPVGPRRAYLFPFSDQVLYPHTMGARTVITRLSVDPPRMSRLLSLLVRTGAARLTARPPLRATLARLRRTAPDAVARYALRVDVENAGPVATATLTGYGQAHATASGTATLVRCLARGEVTQPGAWMPEQVIEPGPFSPAWPTPVCGWSSPRRRLPSRRPDPTERAADGRSHKPMPGCM